LIVAVILLVLGTVGYFVFQKSVGKNIKPYVFTIDKTSIPQDEVSAIYGYYFSKADGSDFDRDATLNNIKDMYVENYVLKKEFEAKGLDQSTLNAKLAAYSVPSSLSGAPQSLIKVTSENLVMREMLSNDLSVNVRSGEILIAKFSPSANQAELPTLETLINTRLTFYKNQLDSGQSIQSVQASYENDTELKSNPGIDIDAAAFANIYKSQPSLEGHEYLDAVFDTPQNKASNVFKSGSGMEVIYGVVYPTTPVPESKYSDFRSWISDMKQSVKVTTDFSSI